MTNGAAMRVSPLGCVLPSAPLEQFCQQVWLASSPTHKSDIAVAGAVVIAWAVAKAVEGASWAEIRLALQGCRLRSAPPEHHLQCFFSGAHRTGLPGSRTGRRYRAASERVYQLVGAGVSTIESVPAALAMVELAQTDPTAVRSCAPTWAVIPTPLARWPRRSAVP
ncbi:ADP-ribosylglycohydrolase [Serratia fonticola]|uniref:ADP-ribosylglycohydrolase n=1 Tax=Serratia fonticola TaxID=47917 RepID=A0A4U9W5E6_SERFO|nr:ADP-ribosylglycohydrolase [Serratia fonticola]